MTPSPNYCVNLRDLKSSDSAIVGGKNANLGELINAGLPVPGGFAITTDLYDRFLSTNDVKTKIMGFETPEYSLQNVKSPEINKQTRKLYKKPGHIANEPGNEEDCDDINLVNGGHKDGKKSIMPFKQKGIFHCKNALCSGRFLTYKGYMAHMEKDVCFVKKQNESIKNYVQKMYIARYSINHQEEQFFSPHDRRYMMTNVSNNLDVTQYLNSLPRHHSEFIVDYKSMGFALKDYAEASKVNSSDSHYLFEGTLSGRRKTKP